MRELISNVDSKSVWEEASDKRVRWPLCLSLERARLLLFSIHGALTKGRIID